LSFLLPCPNCGQRSSYEFDFGGEYHSRPSADASEEHWSRYLYFRTNSEGVQTEWWYHRQGCKEWFLAERNTSTNEVRTSFWPEELKSRVDARADSPPTSGSDH
jgi:heterotetrameric sarcosine oxidase delta subunit